MDTLKLPNQRSPLIRFIVLNSNKSTELIILCHHVICDGLSLTYLAKDIATFLNELKKET
ncbi:MAG: hypothetical protein GX638_12185 [Crenarchaeota archaeon]|nr:hypothetical protein [Thermoproteota archaeon]